MRKPICEQHGLLADIDMATYAEDSGKDNHPHSKHVTGLLSAIEKLYAIQNRSFMKHAADAANKED